MALSPTVYRHYSLSLDAAPSLAGLSFVHFETSARIDIDQSSINEKKKKRQREKR